MLKHQVTIFSSWLRTEIRNLGILGFIGMGFLFLLLLPFILLCLPVWALGILNDWSRSWFKEVSVVND